MKLKTHYEYVIIGSGFGGAFAAYSLAREGKEVLIIDRGVWPKRDDSCWDEKVLHLQEKPLYQGHTSFSVNQKLGNFRKEEWPNDTIGGMSTFYGAAAFRMREADFFGAPLPNSAERDPNSAWPFGYETLKPYYDEAEELQGVAGNKGEDITEPPRGEFPQKQVFPLPHPSQRIWDASKKLNLNPFRLPLAINFDGKHGKGQCILCSTCDHYLCKLEAKNDVSVAVIPRAMAFGAHVLDNVRVTKLTMQNSLCTSLDIVHQETGESRAIHAKKIILAGGALGTPHLLLASGVDRLVPRGDLIGRNLIRHVNGAVAGMYPFKTGKNKVFQKVLGIADYYHGDPGKKSKLLGPWGLLQEVATLGKGVIQQKAQFGVKTLGAFFSDYVMNLMCIGEDIPQVANRVYLDTNQKDRFGMPRMQIYHRYHKRDLQVRRMLYRKAIRIHFKAGAFLFWIVPIDTFSHAAGTAKMGSSQENSVVDPTCKVWNIKNVYITDASVFPCAGSVNPSLTIAANALRVGHLLAKDEI